MPYTFGGNTGDDVTSSVGTTMMAASTAMFISMWIFPTTLTSGRCIWSFGNINCCGIHTTTSELFFNTDESTGAAWNTTGAALAVNKWSYVAVLESHAAASAVAWRVWTGDAENPPVERTVTQTTAPGTGFTGNAALTVGNKGTGVLAFQGDIAQVAFAASSLTGADASFYVPATVGTITQAEADLINILLVQPLWQGDYAKLTETRRSSATGLNTRWFIEMQGVPLLIGNNVAAGNPYISPTVNTALPSNNGCPRPPYSRPFLSFDRR